MDMTFGQLMLSKILPPDVYMPGQPIDKKSINEILGKVANNYPDKYREISYQLLQFGRDAGISKGGASFGISDMRTPKLAELQREKLKQELAEIYNTYGDNADDVVVERLNKATPENIKATLAGAEEEKNPLVLQLKGAGRGSPAALARLLSGDVMYNDSLDNPIAIPVLNSYSDGLSPGEYAASTFGARKGIVTTKLAVADSGFLAKTLGAAAHRLAVMDVDAPPELEQLAAVKGLPVDVHDSDNVGSLLAADFGPYKRNTVITPKIANHLEKLGYDEILVRSPLTTIEPNGGVYARDVGIRENNRLAEVGSIPGLLASAALSEPLTQGALNAKHCLVEGTLVRMADGSSKAIQDIQVGDRVLGSDGASTLVVATYDNGIRECVKTTYSLDDLEFDVLSTSNHGILSQVRDVYTLIEIGKSHKIAMTLNGQAMYIDQISVGLKQVYDIQVDNDDHLFVLADGLIVSNSGGAGKAKVGLTGFELIEKLINPPKDFIEAAALANLDGRVTNITKAPQGGSYVYVGNEPHYVLPGVDINVKPGDTVEAGDQLSEGPLNPRLLIKHKGLGEGSRMLTNQFVKAMRDSGLTVNRRNVEFIMRGALDRVRLTSEMDDMVPDDLVPYSKIEAAWRPRPGHKVTSLNEAKGKYLELPALHYTVGTRVTPSVISKLSKFGVKSLPVHNEPPPFDYEVVRAVDLMHSDPDWMSRNIGTSLDKGLMTGAHRAAVSDTQSSSFVPARALGADFGQEGVFKLES